MGALQPSVSIVIPTYRRGPFLKYALEGLRRQTYKKFEVIVVFKPSGDETEDVLNKYSGELPIVTIKQKHGFVTDAYNLGLKEASGQIVAFLDDDAVPYPNWLEEHVKIYRKYRRVGGVSGTVSSAKISEDEKLTQVPEAWYWYKKWLPPWSLPITNMSSWLVFFGTDGLVHRHQQLIMKNLRGIIPSMLLSGANMSVKREAIEGLRTNENLVLGFTFEQLLSYQIWRRGYRLLYNPYARILHICHKESLGRFFQNPSRATLRDAEYVLSFFILKSHKENVLWCAYLLELATLIVGRALRAQKYGFLTSIHRIYGLLYGSVVGCAFTISSVLGGKFSIRNSLNNLF